MIEIDVLPASSLTRGGDSALIRIGTFDYGIGRNSQTVILIDGGYQENSERIVEYLEKYYDTDTIDVAIITHPDRDHISGFKKLLEGEAVNIKATFIHDPWMHTKKIFQKTQDGRRTVNSIGNAFDETLKALSATLDYVGRKNSEPFGVSRLSGVNVYFIGPDRDYYRELLYQFPGMEGEGNNMPSDIYEASEVNYYPGMQHFLDNPKTSPKNDSSVITLLHDSSRNPIALFTGDAGVDALSRALDNADMAGLDYKHVKLFQIPHHGSIKNISEEIVERISPEAAYVSAPPDKLEHPSRLLLNYFNEQGIRVLHIKDKNGIRFGYDGAPPRPNWSTAAPVQKYTKVHRLKSFFSSLF